MDSDPTFVMLETFDNHEKKNQLICVNKKNDKKINVEYRKVEAYQPSFTWDYFFVVFGLTKM